MEFCAYNNDPNNTFDVVVVTADINMALKCVFEQLCRFIYLNLKYIHTGILCEMFKPLLLSKISDKSIKTLAFRNS